jgi:hypothetical protein
MSLTLEERRIISARLIAEVDAKTKHIQAFDAETESLIAQGHFSSANDAA